MDRVQAADRVAVDLAADAVDPEAVEDMAVLAVAASAAPVEDRAVRARAPEHPVAVDRAVVLVVVPAVTAVARVAAAVPAVRRRGAGRSAVATARSSSPRHSGSLPQMRRFPKAKSSFRGAPRSRSTRRG